MASKGVELLKCVVEHAIKRKAFDSSFLKNVQFLSAEGGNCKAEFTVGEEHLNSGGTLHGGCTSTLVDTISTYALMTAPRGQPGVSVDLHVTFLKAASPGDVIVIDAKTLKAGKTLAFLEVELKKKKDGVIVARGQHTKFIGS